MVVPTGGLAGIAKSLLMWKRLAWMVMVVMLVMLVVKAVMISVSAILMVLASKLSS